MGDDGVGLEVARRLAAGMLPPHARAEIGGSDSLVLPTLWQGEESVWLVDALRRGETPGTVHRLGHDELLLLPQGHRGAHQLSLPESLRWIATSCPEMRAVRYRLWGVEPAVIEPTEGLSPQVEEAVAMVVEAIMRELMA